MFLKELRVREVFKLWQSKIVLFSFIILIALSVFLSGCGGSSKQMCFCHSPYDHSFNHWVFIRNPDFSGGNPLNFFLFKGSKSDCHKACDDLFNNAFKFHERKMTDSHQYLGVEYKLVSVTDDELNKFAIASGLAPISQMIASGNPVNINKSLVVMFENLKKKYDSSNADFLALLNEPKFTFLTHNYQYCPVNEVCAWTNPTGMGGVDDFLLDYNHRISSVFDPDSYSCVSPDVATVVVNDNFCWANDENSNYYPACPNFTKKSEKQILTPYGCLCSKNLIFNKDNIVTRFNTYCCSNGKVINCS